MGLFQYSSDSESNEGTSSSDESEAEDIVVSDKNPPVESGPQINGKILQSKKLRLPNDKKKKKHGRGKKLIEELPDRTVEKTQPD